MPVSRPCCFDISIFLFALFVMQLPSHLQLAILAHEQSIECFVIYLLEVFFDNLLSKFIML